VRQILLDGSSAGESMRVGTSYVIGSGAPSGNSSSVVTVNHGNLQMLGGTIVATPSNANFIYIADAAGAVTLTSVAVGSGSIGFQTTATGCPKLAINGVTGPCMFTPTVVGTTTPGTFTYTRQNGVYTVSRAGVDVSLDLAWSATPVPPVGVDTKVTGFPVASGTIPGACALGFISGLSLDATYVRIGMSVPQPAGNYGLFSEGKADGTTSAYPANLVGPAGTIQAQCHYFP
jgi:hypothetical protein